jgi:uncharacterized membrane protein
MRWIFIIPTIAFRGNTLISYVNSALSLICLILFFIGMKGLAEHYKDKTLHQNTRKIMIYAIVGTIISSVMLIPAYFITLPNSPTGASSAAFFSMIPYLIMLVLTLIITVLQMMCFRKILGALADHTGKQLFHTANTFMYYGLILSIVLVGLFLIPIAFIIMTIAIYSLKKSDTKTKYCTQCGTPNAPENAFCPNCGKQT